MYILYCIQTKLFFHKTREKVTLSYTTNLIESKQWYPLKDFLISLCMPQRFFYPDPGASDTDKNLPSCTGGKQHSTNV